jgi:hypothetical protein
MRIPTLPLYSNVIAVTAAPPLPLELFTLKSAETPKLSASRRAAILKNFPPESEELLK